jgi:hypothetical protein
VRGRAASYEIGGQKMLAASLEDIHPPQSVAGCEPTKPGTAVDVVAAMRLESDRALLQSIRHRLSLPPEKRLNRLRHKVGLRATCL